MHNGHVAIIVHDRVRGGQQHLRHVTGGPKGPVWSRHVGGLRGIRSYKSRINGQQSKIQASESIEMHRARRLLYFVKRMFQSTLVLHIHNLKYSNNLSHILNIYINLELSFHSADNIINL